MAESKKYLSNGIDMTIKNYISGLDNYVILSPSPDFPNIKSGSDIDLLVEDRNYAEKIIVKNLLSEVNKGFEVIVSVEKSHTHIDLIKNTSLYIRIDLIDSFIEFKKIKISRSLPIHILTNKIEKKIGEEIFFFASPLDDLLIRYIEYIEYFEMLPTKEKHLRYLYANLPDGEWNSFIDYCYRFIKIIHSTYQDTSSPRGQLPVLKFIKKIVSRLPYPIQKAIKTIYKKIKK